MVFRDREVDKDIRFENVPDHLGLLQLLALRNLDRFIHILTVAREDICPRLLSCILQAGAGEGELIVVAGVVPHGHSFGPRVITCLDQGHQKLGIVGGGLFRSPGPGDVGLDDHPLPFLHKPSHPSERCHRRLEKLGRTALSGDDEIGLLGRVGQRTVKEGSRR